MRAPKSENAKVVNKSLDEALNKIDPATVKTSNINDLTQSPLLSAPIVKKDYTEHAAVPKVTEVAAPAPVTHESVQNLNKPQSEEFEMEEDSSYVYKPSVEHQHIEDVPEQKINAGAASEPGQATQSTSSNPAGGPIPSGGSENIDQMVQEGADSLADTILGVWQQVIPEAANVVTKMKTRVLKEDVRSGLIDASVIDDIEGRNKENLGLFKNQAKNDVKMMEKPLKKLLAKKGIQAPPHIELILVLIVVLFMNGMLFFQIKKENESFMNKLTARIRERKEATNTAAEPTKA